MSILVLWSSPNTDGLTSSGKEQIIKGIEAAGKQVEEIHLNGKKIDLCQACGNGWGTCRTEGMCVLQDDFDEIYQAFQRAEAVVLVTPVYWHDMSENLKALLDRIRRCEPFCNKFLEGKRCMLAACAGGTGNGTASCLKKMEDTVKQIGMVPLERIAVTRFSRQYMLPAFEGAGKMFAEHFADWK